MINHEMYSESAQSTIDILSTFIFFLPVLQHCDEILEFANYQLLLFTQPNIIATMKFSKKVILPLAFLFGIVILIFDLFHFRHRTETYNSTKHDTTTRVPISHSNNGHSDTIYTSRNTVPQAVLRLATHCPSRVNRFTNHIRLSNLLYNISMKARHGTLESRTFWNPTIFSLPYWAKNQYLIVSMVYMTNSGYRVNVLCEANICHPSAGIHGRSHEKICTDEDLEVLGNNGGLRCEYPPIEVNVPPTPAESCQGDQEGLADIPGFHDPRIFYSGRGEPILMVSSQ